MSARSSRNSFHGRKSSRAASFNSIGSAGIADYSAAGAGLGNLADELGEVWDDQGRGESLLEDLREGDVAVQSPIEANNMYDFGYGVLHSPLPREELAVPPIDPNSLSPPKRHYSHKRVESAYDGSDYGPDSDNEAEEGLPPLLRKRIREIERLSRDAQHPDDVLSEGGGIIPRTTTALRDLGPPQSNIEYGVTRMVTAYTSMATHRTHKQREIFAQSHSLMYGTHIGLLPEELIDDLLLHLSGLTATLPFLPPQNPLLSLQILAAQTNDLASTLRNLTDVLQESRLAANAATRKLKSVKDMVEDMQLEEDLVEDSIMLIQAQDWDRRLRERHAARSCREVVAGFAEKWGVDVPKEVSVGA